MPSLITKYAWNFKLTSVTVGMTVITVGVTVTLGMEIFSILNTNHVCFQGPWLLLIDIWALQSKFYWNKLENKLILNLVKVENSWQLIDKFLKVCMMEYWVWLSIKIVYRRSTKIIYHLLYTYLTFLTIREQQIRNDPFVKNSQCLSRWHHVKTPDEQTGNAMLIKVITSIKWKFLFYGVKKSKVKYKFPKNI